MKTDEEKFTAWVDGEMNPQEAADFEQELERNPELQQEADFANRLGADLKQHAPQGNLSNGDFFNHQILEQIRKEEAAAEPARASSSWQWWRLPKLAWAGVACLFLATLLSVNMIPGHQESTATFMASTAIQSTKTYDPNIYASEFNGPGDAYAVVWLDGLDYLPEDYRIQ